MEKRGRVLCNICRVTEYQRKDGRRKGSCCQILRRRFQPLLQLSNHVRKRGEKSNWGPRVVGESVPSPPSNPSFLRLLHMLARKRPAPRGWHVRLEEEGICIFPSPAPLNSHADSRDRRLGTSAPVRGPANPFASSPTGRSRRCV